MGNAYDRVTWRGARMTRRQRQALIVTEKAIQGRYKGFAFTVPQGSWRPETTYSGTSHTGAGVVDLQYAGFYGDYGFGTKTEQEKARHVLRKLREVGGQGAWLRNKADGMVNHYHVCDLDTTGMSNTSATFQVPQYRQGYNGLGYQVKDRFPYRPEPIEPFDFGAWKRRRKLRDRLDGLTQRIKELTRRRRKAAHQLKELQDH